MFSRLFGWKKVPEEKSNQTQMHPSEPKALLGAEVRQTLAGTNTQSQPPLVI